MMHDEHEYTPIPCDRYSEFEVAILHHERVRVRWSDEGGHDHLEALHPVDLETRDGKEYLHATTDNGEHRRIRLDRVRNTEILHGRQAP